MIDKYNLIYNNNILSSESWPTSYPWSVNVYKQFESSGIYGAENFTGTRTILLSYHYIPYVNTNTYTVSCMHKEENVESTGRIIWFAFNLLQCTNFLDLISYETSTNTYGSYLVNSTTASTVTTTIISFNINSALGAAINNSSAGAETKYIGIFGSPAYDKYDIPLKVYAYSVKMADDTSIKIQLWSNLTIPTNYDVSMALVSKIKNTYGDAVKCDQTLTYWQKKSITLKDASISPITSYLSFGYYVFSQDPANLYIAKPYVYNASQNQPITDPSLSDYIYNTSTDNIEYEVSIPNTMKVKYIRDYGDKWIEIQAYDYLGRNVLYGLKNTYLSTGSGETLQIPDLNMQKRSSITGFQKGHIITNGVINSSIVGLSLQLSSYILVKTPYVNYLTKLVIKHLPNGKCSFNKTEVSEDGVNWITVYDSDIQGIYEESAEGKTIYLDQISGEEQLAVDNYMLLTNNNTEYV